MVQLNLTSRYFLYNRALGGDIALASTSTNDSLVILPLSLDNSKLWYLTKTDIITHFHFHTVEKGDEEVLVAYSDDGDTAHAIMDFHFVQKRNATAQYWTLQDQKDGTVLLSNKYLGNDWSVDIVKDTYPPELTFAKPGMKWTVSEATATPSPTSTARLASSFTATPSSSSTFRTSTISSANASTTTGSQPTPQAKKHLSGGAIAGSVIGSVAGLVIICALIWWFRPRRKHNAEETSTPQMIHRPVYHAGN